MPFRLATAALQGGSAAVRTASLATVSPTSTRSLQHRRQGRSSGGAARTVCSLKGQQLAFDPMLVGGDAFVLLSMQMVRLIGPSSAASEVRLLCRLSGPVTIC